MAMRLYVGETIGGRFREKIEDLTKQGNEVKSQNGALRGGSDTESDAHHFRCREQLDAAWARLTEVLGVGQFGPVKDAHLLPCTSEQLDAAWGGKIYD